MSTSQLKPGNRVLVTTDSLCQYEGFFRAVNRFNGTFTLTKVRSLGSKDGNFGASGKVYDCVEFVASEVVNFLALDDGEDGLRSDPAVVSITRGWSPQRDFGARRSSQPPHGRRTGNQYNTPFNRTRFQRDYRDDYRPQNSHQPFRGNRSETSQRGYRAPQGNHWSQFQSRNPMQREGSFPQKFPGQKKTIGDYDIDKGLEEFSRLKLDGQDEDSKKDKGYNKEKSFFDTLTTDTAEEKKQQPEPRYVSPRKTAQFDQNVLTFGEDTVRSLNFLRKPSFGQGPFQRSGYQGGRNSYNAGGYQPQRRFVNTRGNYRREYV